MVCQTNISEKNSGTLYYHSEHLDATSADNKCISSEQGTLAILDTEEKFRDAIEMAPQNLCPQTYYIIGLNKCGSDFLWLNGNGVRNKLEFDLQPHKERQCGWISPSGSEYVYKEPGIVYFGKCDRRMAFLCFKPSLVNNVPSATIPSTTNIKPSFINNATSSSTTFFMSTVKNFSEEMSFSANPYSTYSTSSQSAMGLPDSTERTSANGLRVGGIAAVAVFTLVIAGILACMKYKKGQFASRSTKIEIENSLYGKIEGHRTHNVRTTPEDEEIDVSPYGVTTIQQDPFNEASKESRSCTGNLTSGKKLCDVSPCDSTTIQHVTLRDNSKTVHKYWQSDDNNFEINQTDMSETETLDQKPQCSVVPLATDLGEAVVYSQVIKPKNACSVLKTKM